MNSDSIRINRQSTEPTSEYEVPEMNFAQKLVRKAVFRLFDRIKIGQLTIQHGEDVFRFGNDSEPSATLTVRDPSCYTQFLLETDIGAARGFKNHAWDVDDLTELIRIFIQNRSLIHDNQPRWSWLLNPFHQILHKFRRNTKQQSRRNIRAHYDLGNKFFKQFLDETMNYSCAVFDSDDEPLAQASKRKMDHICEKLDLREDDHLLEIGTGWGGLAIHAATEYGCRVTTTTISDRQYEFTRKRIRQRGLDNRVCVHALDYRELGGTYDKLVSVEMIEAVGYEFYDTFFEVCQNRLKEHGRAVLQTITMSDQYYEQYRDSTDFIQHFIFPGGCLPSLKAIINSVASTSDFSLKSIETIGKDYVRTLRRWRDRFEQNKESILELGYDESFYRLWKFYFHYCEGGFREGLIDNAQIVLDRPKRSAFT